MPIKDAFNCFGHFYDIYQANQKISECRSVLEIIRKNSSLSEKDISRCKPDAIAVMMNPGNSSPMDSIPERIDIEKLNINFQLKKLGLAIPDGTQIRLMKIMNIKKWNHIRVINLTDIREKNNGFLEKLINDFKLKTKSDMHSIFSDTRSTELKNALTDEDVPIIKAWGTNDCIEDFAHKCLSSIELRNSFGVPSSQFEYLYQHPLTRRISWHSEMIEQLSKC